MSKLQAQAGQPVAQYLQVSTSMLPGIFYLEMTVGHARHGVEHMLNRRQRAPLELSYGPKERDSAFFKQTDMHPGLPA
jgi:hypothetical protein